MVVSSFQGLGRVSRGRVRVLKNKITHKLFVFGSGIVLLLRALYVAFCFFWLEFVSLTKYKSYIEILAKLRRK